MAIIIGGLIAYLLLWPIPIKPQSWSAPDNFGYVGVFAANTELADLERIEVDGLHGPEDIAAISIDEALYLFVSSQDGVIRKVDPLTGRSENFAQTGGVPLGLEFDRSGNLIVADAYRGLLRIDPAGNVQLLSDKADAHPIAYADDLDIGPGGTIYFSDASTKYAAKAAGSTMKGSLLEIMEHGRTGRLLAYDPQSQTSQTVKADLSFANGVAMGPDGKSVLLVETGEYRILRLWLAGPRAGKTDIILDNLPGFPDNINKGPDGTYFVGLVSQRLPILDKLSDKPFWRSVIWRLPQFIKPSAQSYGFIMQIKADGSVLKSWQDPKGDYPLTTGAIAPGDGYLYITSLGADHIGRLKL